MTAFFPGIRPHGSTLYATDFGSYPVGVAPADFMQSLNPNATVTVETVAAAYSGKALRIAKAADLPTGMLKWLALPTSITDGEMLTRLRRTTTTSNNNGYHGHFHRYTGTDVDDRSGYRFIAFRGDANMWSQADRYVSGTQTTLGSSNHGNIASNEWFWLRSRVVGTSIQRKLWKDTDAEPGFISDTNSSVSGPGEMQLVINLTSSAALGVEIDYVAMQLPNDAGTVPTIPLPF